MFESELKARQRRFEKGVKERSLQNRRKWDLEKRQQERARREREQREAEKTQRRIQEETEKRQEEERQETMREQNRGVFFEANLIATPLPEMVALQKGIKRWRDKVLLPASVGAELMNQEASRNGGLMFQIKTPSGARTHAGVLEFTAPEGTICLPKKVVRSLWGPEGECTGPVSVSYSRLEPGIYARLQPLRSGFHEAVGDEMRAILEEAFKTHSTLTEGDLLEVEHNGETHDLQVLELQPPSAVSIIDTDLEVDVGPSAETEAAILAEQEAARKAEEEEARIQRELQQQQEEMQRRQREEAERQLRKMEERKQLAKTVADSLPPEVTEDCGEPTTLCMVRLLDGSRCQRRFRLKDPVKLLFDFVDSQESSPWPGTYALVTRLPRRVF